jgi:NAD(P)-dependent dehydrogenase (short-subunit alcohol dehydrogenase family)
MNKPQIATNVDVSVLRDVFEPNLFGLVQTTTTLLPLVRKSQQGPGVILNVSSELASNAWLARPNLRPYFVAYNTSKVAVNSYTIALNHELRVEGSPIRVNCVTPGFTSTKLNNFSAGGKPPKRGAEVLFPWTLLDAGGPTGDFMCPRCCYTLLTGVLSIPGLFIGQGGKELPW